MGGFNAQVARRGARSAPVIAATRLRRGAAASAHGAARLIGDAIATRRRAGVIGPVMVRADCAYYRRDVIAAAISGPGLVLGGGPDGPGGAGSDRRHRLPPRGRQIMYPSAISRPSSGELISAAEIAEIPYTAFTSHKRGPVTAGSIVRRVANASPPSRPRPARTSCSPPGATTR